jgi:CheY-like chemotaxis protein
VIEQRTIMIVEDDVDIADLVATTLEDDGYAVLVATNGQEALDKLRAAGTRPSLILLDLMMPVMDGWQFRKAQTADPALAEMTKSRRSLG